jgi:hypothetical protein
MGAERWVNPEQTDFNYRTMTLPELERLWVSNRNRLEGMMACEELMRRYSRGEVLCKPKE